MMSRIILFLVVAALAAAQVFIGGAKLVYALPVYLLLGAAACIAAISGRERMLVPNSRPIAAAGILTAYIALRCLFSPVGYLARSDLFMVLGAGLVYWLASTRLVRSSLRMTLIGVLFALAGCHLLSGIVQFRGEPHYMFLSWMTRPDYEWRASGFYICPNHLAGMLEMLAMFSLSVCIWGRGALWLRILLGYITAMCLVAVAMTGSRGGYISTVAGLMAFVALSLWIVKRQRPRLYRPLLAWALVGAFVFAGAAVAAMSASDVIARRAKQIYDPNNMRLLLWKSALVQWQRNPVFGTGAGTYLYYGRQFRSEWVQNDPQHVHNDYLELLAEYGLVGFVLFGGFLVVHVRSGWAGFRESVERRIAESDRDFVNLPLLIGTLCALAALAVHSVIDFNLHIPANALFVAFLFGILSRPIGPLPADYPRVLFPRWAQFTPAGVGVVLILAAPVLWAGEYLGERARMALRDRRFEEARDWALKAIAWEKFNPDLHYYLGEARHHEALEKESVEPRVQLHLDSVAAYQEGLRLFPHDLRLLLKLGRALDNLGRFEEAQSIYERALKADPNFGNVHAHYAVHWQLRQEPKKAEELFLKARSLGEEELSMIGLQELQPKSQPQASPANVVPEALADFVHVQEDDDEGTPAPAAETAR